MSGKIYFGWNVLKVYKSWYLGFLDYFGLLGKRKIVHVLRNGLKYVMRTGTNDFAIMNEIFIRKVYHELLGKIKPGSTVIDVGGQIGVFTVLAASLNASVKVFSVEPVKENLDLLYKNVRLNGVEGQVKVYTLGRGTKRETRALFLSEENSGGHSLFRKGARQLKINTIPLKDVFDENNIKCCDFLKLDCEGAEYEIIFTTPNAYLERVQNISLECHENGSVKEMKEFLERKGFRVWSKGLTLPMVYATREEFPSPR